MRGIAARQRFETAHHEELVVRGSSAVEPSVWIEVDDKTVVLIRIETLREMLAFAESTADTEENE